MVSHLIHTAEGKEEAWIQSPCVAPSTLTSTALTVISLKQCMGVPHTSGITPKVQSALHGTCFGSLHPALLQPSNTLLKVFVVPGVLPCSQFTTSFSFTLLKYHLNNLQGILYHMYRLSLIYILPLIFRTKTLQAYSGLSEVVSNAT